MCVTAHCAAARQRIGLTGSRRPVGPATVRPPRPFRSCLVRFNQYHELDECETLHRQGAGFPCQFPAPCCRHANPQKNCALQRGSSRSERRDCRRRRTPFTCQQGRDSWPMSAVGPAVAVPGNLFRKSLARVSDACRLGLSRWLGLAIPPRTYSAPEPEARNQSARVGDARQRLPKQVQGIQTPFQTNSTKKVVPSPSRLSSQMRPPCKRTICWVMNRPKPVVVSP